LAGSRDASESCCSRQSTASCRGGVIIMGRLSGAEVSDSVHVKRKTAHGVAKKILGRGPSCTSRLAWLIETTRTHPRKITATGLLSRTGVVTVGTAERLIQPISDEAFRLNSGATKRPKRGSARSGLAPGIPRCKRSVSSEPGNQARLLTAPEGRTKTYVPARQSHAGD